MRTLKLGDRGKEVLDVQSRLSSLGYDVGTDGVDGLFGTDTRMAVMCFQQQNGLLVDGIVAGNTWQELVEARYDSGERLLYLRMPPFRGADVLMLQRALNRLGFNAGPEDAIFGARTERAVLDFQKNAGLVMDGMVDESVLRVMAKVTKDGEPHRSSAKIPDRNGGHAGGRSLKNLTVAIDAGHGGDDAGAVSVHGIVEKSLNLGMALKLAAALESFGAHAFLTREDDSGVDLYERAELANLSGADLFISIHHNSDGNLQAQGAAAYFFCREGYFSEQGKMLAQQIVDNLAVALRVPALPVLGRNYALLRETSMTAILVEPFFLTGPLTEEILTAEELAAAEAAAVMAGLREYFAGE